MSYQYYLIPLILIVAIFLVGKDKPKWLLILSVVGFVAIYGTRDGLQEWNVFHYYTNAKYAQELGYRHLYACATTAQPDIWGKEMRRDLYSYQYTATGGECPVEQFSPERWATFQQDIAWLYETSDYPYLWTGMIRDKGLNTTPFWLALAEPIANLVPPGTLGFWFFLHLDFWLIMMALGLAWRVFGAERAALAGLFLVTWMGTMPQLTGHWFQYVWLALALIGVALYQHRPGISGAALAMATGLRVFPAVLFLWPLLHWKQTPKRFWGGAVTAGAGALLIGSFSSLGFAVWPEFLTKMIDHSGYIVHEPGNFGLRNLIYTLLDWQNSIPFWESFAGGEAILPDSYGVNPLALWLPTAVLSGMAVYAAHKQKRPFFSAGLPVLFSSLVLSRYYYSIFGLTFLEANKKQARRLLAVSLAFFVFTNFLHPLVGYLLGQIILFIVIFEEVKL